MKQLVTVYGMRSNWVSLELRENRGGGGEGWEVTWLGQAFKRGGSVWTIENWVK